MDEDMTVGVLIYTLVLSAVFIGVGIYIGSSIAEPSIEGMGQMICDDKDLGGFVDFDEDSKTVKCEPKPEREQFDGGYVQVVHGGEQK